MKCRNPFRSGQVVEAGASLSAGAAIFDMPISKLVGYNGQGLEAINLGTRSPGVSFRSVLHHGLLARFCRGCGLARRTLDGGGPDALL